jgi:hypothetical protein
MDDLEREVFGPLREEIWVYPGHGQGHDAGRERAVAPDTDGGQHRVALGITGTDDRNRDLHLTRSEAPSVVPAILACLDLLAACRQPTGSGRRCDIGTVRPRTGGRPRRAQASQPLEVASSATPPPVLALRTRRKGASSAAADPL